MKRLAYAIIMVSDMKRSVEFYRQKLGLALKFESSDWTEFSNEGSTLALHPTARANSESPEAQPYPAGHCQLGFTVDDLDAFHKQMESNGVRCIRPPKMEDFGSRLALYADPDGLPISVAENPK